MILIFLLIAAGSLFIYIAYNTSTSDNDIGDIKRLITFIYSTLGAIAAFVSAIVLFCVVLIVSMTEPAELAAYQTRYDSLMHQINMYDDGDYSRRDLYSDIERWNCDLTRRKKMRENIFIRDFYYNISGFQLIEYPDS